MIDVHRSIGYRAGVDIGGTFTDLILMGPDGSTETAKVATTASDYGAAIVAGLRELLDRGGLSGDRVETVLHATTLASNMIIEGTGARTALITTAGFRDVLEIGRGRTPRLYDVQWVRPAPLVPRHLRLEVAERLDHRGNVVQALDVSGFPAIVEQLRREEVEAVAVVFINSYANPEHERQAAAALADLAPDLVVCLSTDVLPEIKEFERTSTTVINAYLAPGVRRYLRNLEARLAGVGVTAPVWVLQSNGGLTTAALAAERPVTIIESGPAAGVVGAIHLGHHLGVDNLITFDVGGTTAKAAIVERGEAGRAAEFEVGAGIITGHRLLRGDGYLVRAPVIDIAEVGAGGGSIVWADEGGSLRVGPRSAGAVPGPACYGKGGIHPTVTDADLLLGYLGQDSLLGGSFRVDPDLARQAFEREVAGPLGIDLVAAAYGAHAVANANMMRALRAVTTERGRDPRDFVLFAFGGSGPVHAAQMAHDLGCRRVLVPPHAGVFSAYGLLTAAVERHGVQTIPRGAERSDAAALAAHAARLARAVETDLTVQGFPADAIATRVLADVRYVGQLSELTVPFPSDGGADLVNRLRAAFDEEHRRTFGHWTPDDPIEVVSVRAIASVASTLDGHIDALRPASAAAGGERLAYFGTRFGWLATPVLGRDQVGSSWRAGPLIVEEYDATTVVPPGARVRVESHGLIEIEVGAA